MTAQIAGRREKEKMWGVGVDTDTNEGTDTKVNLEWPDAIIALPARLEVSLLF
jgi:hypothetical protein